MFRIATNVALNERRDRRHRQADISMDQPAEGGEDDSPAMQVADRQPGIEHELMQRQRAAAIRQALEVLPEKQRAAVLLHKYQEMDYEEIARVLSCSESALKSLLFRAYETLRIELAPLVGNGRESRNEPRAGTVRSR
jgi:RNA polymerase sigma-70 factor (ECF subfamily)